MRSVDKYRLAVGNPANNSEIDQLLVEVGNPFRLVSESRFACQCGTGLAKRWILRVSGLRIPPCRDEFKLLSDGGGAQGTDLPRAGYEHTNHLHPEQTKPETTHRSSAHRWQRR